MGTSVLLLSGGLDSTVNLYQAVSENKNLLLMTFDYGQRAFKNELECSKWHAKNLNLDLKVIELNWMKQEFTQSSLLEGDFPPLNVDIDNMKDCHESAKKVWVPNRNGIMLNIAASYCDYFNLKEIIVGFNFEEGKTFPDNTIAFLDLLNLSFKYSTLNAPYVFSYTIDMDKTQIVQLGKNLKVPFEKVWPCYFGGEKMCGVCESCLRFMKAMKNNKL